MYIVKYSTGPYDDYSQNTVFVTNNSETASNYVLKFNKILNKWKQYWAENENPKYGLIHEVVIFQDFNTAWIEEIEER